MPSEREIFSAALEIEDIAARSLYLDSVCGLNTGLRQQIELLLDAAGVRDDFMTDSPLVLHIEQGGDATGEVKSLSALRGEQVFPEFSPGSTLARYRIERLLGKGGMATVYLATDLRLKRAVALKIPRQLLLDEPELLQRFEREAHTMASVEHPNLCRVFDIGEHEGIPYLSMSFIEGQTLAAVIEGGMRFTAHDAAELVRKLAQATHFAHSAGVVHRDLKPANVMMDPQGEPVIMDFGLALVSQVDSRLTRNGLIMGTPAYMAPEQALADAKVVGPQCDVYSLGAILYELLVGKPLYQGSTVSVLAQLVSDSQINQRFFIPSNIDWRLQAICMKALAKDVKERYASAQQLATALSNFLNGVEDAEGQSHVTQVKARTNTQLKRSSMIVSLVTIVAIAISLPWIYEKSRDDEARASVTEKKLGLASVDVRWSNPSKLGGPINTALKEENPTLSADGNVIVFNRPLNGFLQLWEARRKSVDEEFGDAVPLPPTINVPGHIHDCPLLSPDGLTLCFSSNRPGGFGKHDIWFAQRVNLDAQWNEPTHLDEAVNSSRHDQTPYLTTDGLTIYFSRDVQPGVFQLFMASRRSVTEPFQKAELLDNLNIGDCSSFPRLTSDGELMVFAHSPTRSNRLLIYAANRDPSTGKFHTPFLLTDQLGPADCSAPYLSADERTLYFSSQRADGVNGSMDIWMTKRIESE
jgi:serine/threonine protein kinase